LKIPEEISVTAIDVSSVLGLMAIGIFSVQILLGLLLSTGYNPVRRWPRRRLKLFTFHNWLGYIGLATACLHPLTLLASSTARFRLFDIVVPLWSPTQPLPNTLGAVALYLVAFVVLTSYFRQVFGHHNWKLLHYTAYAAAAVFFVHGVLADPLLQNRPVDFIDAEKVYVEACAALVLAAAVLRIRHRPAVRRNL
jgi:methionine sulfoxide reductase heme-binding subunit